MKTEKAVVSRSKELFYVAVCALFLCGFPPVESRAESFGEYAVSAGSGGGVSEVGSGGFDGAQEAMAGMITTNPETAEQPAGGSEDTMLRVFEPGGAAFVSKDPLSQNETVEGAGSSNTANLSVVTMALNGENSFLLCNESLSEPYLFTDTHQRVWEIRPAEHKYIYKYTMTQAEPSSMVTSGAALMGSGLYSLSAERVSLITFPGTSQSAVFLEEGGVEGVALLDTGVNIPSLVTDNQERTWKFDPAAQTIELTDIQYIGSKEELVSVKPAADKEYQLYRIGNNDIYYISFQKMSTMQQAMNADERAAGAMRSLDKAIIWLSPDEEALSTEQENFRDYLVSNGLIVSAGEGYLLQPDIQLMATAEDRTVELEFGELSQGIEHSIDVRHELNHILYEINPEYKEAVTSEYDSLTQEEKDGVYSFLSVFYPEEVLNDRDILISEYLGYFGDGAIKLREVVNICTNTPLDSFKPKTKEFAAFVKNGTIDHDFLTDHGNRLRALEETQLDKIF